MEVLFIALRVVGFSLAGLAVAQAIVININTYKLRKASKVAAVPRLVAWHIHAITVYSLGFHLLMSFEIYLRLEEPLSWRSPLALVLGVVGNTALWIILRVTRARLALSEVENDEPLRG